MESFTGIGKIFLSHVYGKMVLLDGYDPAINICVYNMRNIREDPRRTGAADLHRDPKKKDVRK